MLTIKKDGKIIEQAKDNPNYMPTYETEKDKPNTLYAHQQQERGLTDGA